MQESRQVNYTRIGSFVITGIILIVIAIIVFGSGMLFKRVVYVETYFNESVQGVTVGSAVKYLGMDIGTVKGIAAVDSVYKIENHFQDRKHNRYIYVLMAIKPKFFLGASNEDIKRELTQDIANGLRVKLALQGLTGTAYLELDFVDQNAQTVLPITWKPKHYYIPSTVSTLAYFSDNVQNLMRKFSKLKLQKMVNSAQDFFTTAARASHRLDNMLAQTHGQVVGTVNNLQNITNNLDALSERARAFSSSVIFGKAPPKLNPGKL
ncbi:MAG: MCE family protein [Gammaproteobacteria bacterium]|nr:MCE family protein [Gammaproteobacteria bacterium]